MSQRDALIEKLSLKQRYLKLQLDEINDQDKEKKLREFKTRSTRRYTSPSKSTESKRNRQSFTQNRKN